MENEQKIWRYMSQAKFTHALSQKALWLARSDKLGDAWEMALDGKPLDKIISRHPISPVGEGVKETAIERTKRIMPLWRQQTFVSCWTVSESESHALWQIYCGNKEGVAIQTTYDRLKNSLQQHLALNFLKVNYDDLDKLDIQPTKKNLISLKRPMFSYENELRVVQFLDEGENTEMAGISLNWNPSDCVEAVLVHPAAEDYFRDAVSSIFSTLAPTLSARICWSKMRTPPRA